MVEILMLGMLGVTGLIAVSLFIGGGYELISKGLEDIANRWGREGVGVLFECSLKGFCIILLIIGMGLFLLLVGLFMKLLLSGGDVNAFM